MTGPDTRQRAGAAGPGSTRVEATATCLSWIPPQAVEGVFKLPFGLGVAHYDKPNRGEQGARHRARQDSLSPGGPSA